MTAKKRAENIVLASRQDRYAKATVFFEFIVAQIEEAEREANESFFAEGFLAAREKAKELAQEEWKRHPIPQINPSENAELTSLRIRDAIKQMEPEE